MKRPGDAKKNFDKAISADSRKSKYFYGLGDSEMMLGNQDAALEAYKKALSVGYTAGEVNALKNIGNTYYYISKYDSSEKYYFKALFTGEKAQYEKEKPNLLHNIGLIYSEQGQYHHG